MAAVLRVAAASMDGIKNQKWCPAVVHAVRSLRLLSLLTQRHLGVQCSTLQGAAAGVLGAFKLEFIYKPTIEGKRRLTVIGEFLSYDLKH